MNYDIALKITDEGLYSTDLLDLFNRTRSLQVLPLTVKTESRTAIGFITPEADCDLHHDHTSLSEFIKDILTGSTPEREDHTYNYCFFPDGIHNKEILIYLS